MLLLDSLYKLAQGLANMASGPLRSQVFFGHIPACALNPRESERWGARPEQQQQQRDFRERVFGVFWVFRGRGGSSSVERTGIGKKESQGLYARQPRCVFIRVAGRQQRGRFR